MDFETWLRLQRYQPATLRVRPGDYILAGTLVRVTAHGVVRARVHYKGAEYDFTPAWTSAGLRGHRTSPRGELPRDLQRAVHDLARAALLQSAREEYDYLCGLAREATGGDAKRFADALVALTAPPKEATSVDVVLRQSLVAILLGRTDGVELLVVREPCCCVGCDRRFEPGDHGPVRLFGGSALCGACLSPARAA